LSCNFLNCHFDPFFIRIFSVDSLITGFSSVSLRDKEAIPVGKFILLNAASVVLTALKANKRTRITAIIEIIA